MTSVTGSHINFLHPHALPDQLKLSESQHPCSKCNICDEQHGRIWTGTQQEFDSCSKRAAARQGNLELCARAAVNPGRCDPGGTQRDSARVIASIQQPSLPRAGLASLILLKGPTLAERWAVAHLVRPSCLPSRSPAAATTRACSRNQLRRSSHAEIGEYCQNTGKTQA